jgi:hypothetical protein
MSTPSHPIFGKCTGIRYLIAREIVIHPKIKFLTETSQTGTLLAVARQHLGERMSKNFRIPVALYEYWEREARKSHRYLNLLLCDILEEAKELKLTGLRGGKSITGPEKHG